MYLGKIMELGSRDDVFARPVHPYTQSLLSSVPSPDPDADRSGRIRLTGDLPHPSNPPSGCVFRTRCPLRPLLSEEKQQLCMQKAPSGPVACHHRSDAAEFAARTPQERTVHAHP